jgi:hypothetical protein
MISVKMKWLVLKLLESPPLQNRSSPPKLELSQSHGSGIHENPWKSHLNPYVSGSVSLPFKIIWILHKFRFHEGQSHL